MEFCEPCDKDPARYDRIKSFLRDKKTVYAWHHTKDSGFDFSDTQRMKMEVYETIYFIGILISDPKKNGVE
jgi:hypothetical protein